MPLRKRKLFFNLRKKVPMGTKPRGRGAKGLSDRATKKRIFFAASLSKKIHRQGYGSEGFYERIQINCIHIYSIKESDPNSSWIKVVFNYVFFSLSSYSSPCSLKCTRPKKIISPRKQQQKKGKYFFYVRYMIY